MFNTLTLLSMIQRRRMKRYVIIIKWQLSTNTLSAKIILEWKVHCKNNSLLRLLIDWIQNKRSSILKKDCLIHQGLDMSKFSLNLCWHLIYLIIKVFMTKLNLMLTLEYIFLDVSISYILTLVYHYFKLNKLN